MNNYLESLQNSTRKFWDKSALNTIGGESFTYSQMATLIEKFHILFDEMNLGKGHVALWAKNGARWGMSFFAINTYGAVVVPLLSDFTPEAVERLATHSDSTILLTNTDKWQQLDITRMPGVKLVMDIDKLCILHCSDKGLEEKWERIDELMAAKYPHGFGPEDVVYPADNMDDLAVISYTSGSTGEPKGVMLTYRNFSATIEFSNENRPSSDKDKMVSMLPMAHMYGLVTEFMYPICNGTSIYWMAKAPTPTVLLNAFQQVRPYQLITVPLVMEKIFKSKIKPTLEKPAVKAACCIPGLRQLIFSKVRNGIIDAFGGNVTEIILGGAAVDPEIEKWFKKIRLPYMVGYGMTEATPLLAYVSPKEYVAGSCGRPVSCCDVRIDSDDPANIPGEIQAKGDNICIGYYNNPKATAEAFTEDGYLKTGDIGIIDKDGNVFIKGRCKCMILGPSGQNIYPEEIEVIINEQDYVSESIVVERDGRLVALVYPEGEAVEKDKKALEAVGEKIISNVNRRMPSYSRLRSVEFMDKPFEKTPKMSIKRFLYK